MKLTKLNQFSHYIIEPLETIIYMNIKQLLTFVEVDMLVCGPDNPILTEALAEVNIMDIHVCKQTY